MIAREGEHYVIIYGSPRWLHFKRKGNAELTCEQREMITTAFWAKKLGDSFTFPEPTFKFTEAEETNGRDNTEAIGIYQYTEAEEARLADNAYKEKRIAEEFA